MKHVIVMAAGALLAGAVQAQSSWRAAPMSNNEGVYAAVVNDSGVAFGRYCYHKDETCYWLIANTLKCVEGEEYPALATARSASHLTLICAGAMASGSLYRYFIKPYDTIDQHVKEGGILGIAMVSESGNFRVNRFDLNGAVRVLEQADSIFRSRARTKDQTL